MGVGHAEGRLQRSGRLLPTRPSHPRSPLSRLSPVIKPAGRRVCVERREVLLCAACLQAGVSARTSHEHAKGAPCRGGSEDGGGAEERGWRLLGTGGSWRLAGSRWLCRAALWWRELLTVEAGRMLAGRAGTSRCWS